MTLINTRHKVIKQGLYERDFFMYDFLSDDGVKFHYAGGVKAIFIGKRYEVVATSKGYSFGAIQLKCPRFQPEGDKGNELFERA